MNVLYLGNYDSPLISFLKKEKENVIVTNEMLSDSLVIDKKIDYIVSYCYRHLIKKEILDLLPGRVINLHISYLPFNKGADPNFWSFIEFTPKGISIHAVDEGLDSGDIIYQEAINLSESDNLKTTYAILQNSIQSLFKQNWSDLKRQNFNLKKQIEKGTYHKSSEKECFVGAIKDRWLDMPIYDLLEYINDLGSARQFWNIYYEECRKLNLNS